MRGVYRVLLLGLSVAGCYGVETTTPVNPGPGPVVDPTTGEVKTPEILDFKALQPSVSSGTSVELQYKVKDAEFVKVDMGSVNLLPASIALEGRLFTPAIMQNASIVLTATNKDKKVSR